MRKLKKTLFGSIIVLLVISIIALFYLSISKHVQRKRDGQSLEKSAKQASSSIELILSEKEHAVEKLSENSLLKPSSISLATETALKRFCSRNKYFLWASITDTDGITVASSSSSQIDEAYSDNVAFNQAMKGENWVTEVYPEGDDLSVVYFSRPIYEREKIVGTIIAVLDGEGLNHILRQARVSQKGVEILADHNGEIIASAQDSEVFKLTLADFEVGRSALSGASGFVLGKDTKGKGVIFGYAPTNIEKQWTVLVSAPYNEGRRPEIFGFSATIVFLFLVWFVLYCRSFFLGALELEVPGASSENTGFSSLSRSASQREQAHAEVDKVAEGLSVSTQGKGPKAGSSFESGSVSQMVDVVGLVDKIVLDAVLGGASDIHIDPHEDGADVRYRVDGRLCLVGVIPKDLQLAVISRIKTMANLDAAKRLEDERVQVKVGGKEVECRISAFPTILGEKFVLKILDLNSAPFHLEDIGLSYTDLPRFYDLLQKPSGMILVTGPGGSGKTTTLYSALNALKTSEKNIITLEDPVECRIRGVNQGQINPNAGVTFATGLKLILGQDSDVIMVGEVRDSETAKLAIQAALAGRLVLSTLDTLDAPSTLTRLINMDIEPSLIASSLSAVVVQRLVRRTCAYCKEEYTPPKDLVNQVGWKKRDLRLYHGVGCPKCMNTGFKGRTGLFEILVVDQKVKELIISKAPTEAIGHFVKQAGIRTLLEDGLEKVLRGITTLDELIRITMLGTAPTVNE